MKISRVERPDVPTTASVLVDPHRPYSVNVFTALCRLWKSRQLIISLTRREVVGRYKGSIIGIGWSFLHPMLMLSVYTFVFSVAFKARWSAPNTHDDDSKAMFAIVLFVGMIIHSVFAEILNRSCDLIRFNANYVKKVVFPLELLPVVTTAAASIHSLISFLVWLAAYVALIGLPHPQFLLLPLIMAPLIVLALGIGWALAALGVYVRDIGQTTTIVTTIMLFLAPVFYPIQSLPEAVQPIIMANPLTFIIEQARDVLIWGKNPDFIGLLAYFAVSLAVLWAGFALFQKTRKGFADAL